MKKILVSLFAIIISASAFTQEFVEGVHYTKFRDKGTNKPVVTEFFSFYCPHCHKFEHLADELKKVSKEHGFEFDKSHVDFLSMVSKEEQHNLTKALALSDKLKKPEVVTTIFSEIHIKRNLMTNIGAIKAVFIQHGVSGAQFDKEFDSAENKAMANAMKAKQHELNSLGVLRGVPTFIINDQYVLNSQGFKGVTSFKQFFEIAERAIVHIAKKDFQ